MKKSDYMPRAVFGNGSGETVPRVMIAPARYIQGPDVIDQLGQYLSLIPAERVSLLISSGGKNRLGSRLEATLKQANISYSFCLFDGECSYKTIDSIARKIGESHNASDCLVAVGGGKCIDAGKAIAFRLGVPVVICPTIASTDAPTSAVAVIYQEDGIAIGGEFYPNSPAMVVVDTAVIAKAPARYLAAGIADALASLYELGANFSNPNGRSMVGGRPPMAVKAMVEAGAEVLFNEGAAAITAVNAQLITPELENVIEVNTLSSGIGFESGGLAVVHAVAKGLTAVQSVRENYLHGELVAIGILTQLALLEEWEESKKVIRLFNDIRLPTCLNDLGIDVDDKDSVNAVVHIALEAPFVHNVGFKVTAVDLHNALRQLNKIEQAQRT